jgi:hypothetical protein
MAKPLIQIGRNLSEHRLGAYECIAEGSTVRKGTWVAGWYGTFSEDRLREEIMPKLSEYVQQSLASYPILITSYMLEAKTDACIDGDTEKAKERDVKFRPRRRRMSQQYEAIVHSKTRYQLLR